MHEKEKVAEKEKEVGEGKTLILMHISFLIFMRLRHEKKGEKKIRMKKREERKEENQNQELGRGEKDFYQDVDCRKKRGEMNLNQSLEKR